MSDGVPTPEQLARMQRGVMHRIDRRRRVGHRIAGTAVAVALVGGGFALVGPNLSFVGSSGASSTAGRAEGGTSGGAASSAQSAAGTSVLCHASASRGSATREVTVDPAALPASAAEACAGTTDLQTGDGRMPNASKGDPSSGTTAGPTPFATPLTFGIAVCRAPDDVLHAYPLGAAPSADARCARNGMVVVDP